MSVDQGSMLKEGAKNESAKQILWKPVVPSLYVGGAVGKQPL